MEAEVLSKFLKKIGFDEESIEDILLFSNNEIDIKDLYNKVKYLTDIKCSARVIRIIIEENPLFFTTELEDIEKVINYFIQKGLQEYVSNILEVCPEILSVQVGKIQKNEEILKFLINEDKVKMLLRDRTEIFTYNNDYLANRIRFFVENGLKDKIEKIIITRIEVFELEEDEIDLQELQENL